MEPTSDSDGAEPRDNKYETGKFLVVFEDDAQKPHTKLAEVGLSVAGVSRSKAAGPKAARAASHEADYFQQLKVAVVPGAAEQELSKLRDDPTVRSVEPERYVFAGADDLTAAATEFSATFVRPSPFIQRGMRPSPFIQRGMHPYPFIQGGMQPYPFIQNGVQPYPFIQNGMQPYPFIQGGVQPYPFIQDGVGPYPFIQASAAAMATYLTGFRDAAQSLLDRFGGASQAPGIDQTQATWGLQATRAVLSRYSGSDIGIAVLDTGFDLEHPDFRDRSITSRSFITGETPQDVHGHGTHCIGTACGPLEPEFLPRYGIAYESKIFAGKVLNNKGRGTDGEVLAGIEWAIASGCRVVSMSLGTPTRRDEPFSPAFEQVAQRALNRGTIIVAAAGNESRRDMNIVNPVSHPANCPSIMAVAAVDQNMHVAFFSNQGSATGGGQVDISGPGIDIYSSLPMPTRYGVLDGTSMATPHVAGVAALFAELKPDATATELKGLLQRTAMKIPGAVVDVGAGLVQAP